MGMLQEFKKFILRGNVVDLAIGIVIGAAFGSVVASLVEDLFRPLIGFVTGGFKNDEFLVYNDLMLHIGNFLSKIFNFVIIGFCMFMVVKGMNILQKKKDEAPPPPTPSEVLLTEIRDLLKAKV